MSAENIRIDIKPATKKIVSLVLSFEIVITSLACVAGLIGGIYLLKEIFVLGVFTILASVGIFYLVRRQFRGVIYKEYAVLEKDLLKIFYESGGKKTEYHFVPSEINYFSYAGYREYTEHPMSSENLDITGLQTGEKVMQFIIDDGTIEIETDKEVHRFGKNVPSWDAEEFIEKIENFYGIKFQNKYPAPEIESDEYENGSQS